MKNLIYLSILGLFISCALFNKAEAKADLHYYNTVSYGQQLLDLKETLDKNAITQAEYDSLKQIIKNNVIDIPAGIEKLDKELDELID